MKKADILKRKIYEVLKEWTIGKLLKKKKYKRKLSMLKLQPTAE